MLSDVFGGVLMGFKLASTCAVGASQHATYLRIPYLSAIGLMSASTCIAGVSPEATHCAHTLFIKSFFHITHRY